MRRSSKSPAALTALVLFFASIVAPAVSVAGNDTKLTTLPAAVDAAIEALVPNYLLKKAKLEEDDGEAVYEVKGTATGLKFEIELTAIGTVLKSEIEFTGKNDTRTTIATESLPSAVVGTLMETAKGIRVDEIKLKTRNEGSYFEIEGHLDGDEVEVEIALDGTLIDFQREGEDEDDGEDEGEEDNETNPAHRLLPGAIYAALMDEFPGLKIEEVEVSSIEGMTRYKVESKNGPKRIDVYVTPSGEIVKIEMDTDDDGLTDSEEAGMGLDPEDPDTDNDSFPDGFESGENSDPLDAKAVPQILRIEKMVGIADGPDFVKISVSTFSGSEFVVEHCPDAKSWESIGASIRGDGSIYEVMIPVIEGEQCGFFRVSIGELSNEAGEIGGATGTTDTCFAPENLDGLKFDLDLGDEDAGELVFRSRKRGQVVTSHGNRINIEPFGYDYRRTGNCSGTVTVSFPRPGEDHVVEYELQFTEDGRGNVVRKDGSSLDTGTFTYRTKSPRNN
jgi:uncharacterized membrane protein YkoI